MEIDTHNSFIGYAFEMGLLNLCLLLGVVNFMGDSKSAKYLLRSSLFFFFNGAFIKCALYSCISINILFCLIREINLKDNDRSYLYLNTFCYLYVYIEFDILSWHSSNKYIFY